MTHSLNILAQATARQDEVFRSIQESLGAPTDPTPLLIFMGLLAAAVVIIAVVQHRRGSASSGDSIIRRSPKPVHNHAKLTRELTVAAGVDAMTLSAAAARAKSVGAQSPLTVLLLSSLRAPKQADKRG